MKTRTTNPAAPAANPVPSPRVALKLNATYQIAPDARIDNLLDDAGLLLAGGIDLLTDVCFDESNKNERLFAIRSLLCMAKAALDEGVSKWLEELRS